MIIQPGVITVPRVSVIMPSYNSAEYIEKAIRSVMMQTFTDWELLVVDDGSQDATCDIVEALRGEDIRVRLIRSDVNEGAAKTRNKGLDACRGEYAALLDSDDIWHPRKLEVQLRVAERENADIVYCSYGIIDEEGNQKCPDFIVPERTSAKDTLTKSVISCSTALLSSNVVQKYRFPGGYYHEDLAFWLQLLTAGMKAVGTPEVLADYRVRSNSRASNKFTVARGRWQIYRKMMNMPLLKSSYYFAKYAVTGFLKYRKR